MPTSKPKVVKARPKTKLRARGGRAAKTIAAVPKRRTKESLQPSPPMEWPEYSKGPMTIEEIRDVERRQLEYKAYHGAFAWENVIDESDDSLTESDSEEEWVGDQPMEQENSYCPESLEDEDLLRVV